MSFRGRHVSFPPPRLLAISTILPPERGLWTELLLPRMEEDRSQPHIQMPRFSILVGAVVPDVVA